MPSKSNSKQTSLPAGSAAPRPMFLSLVALTFVTWMLYRFLFAFDVWFDELIGKAIFFGMPVMLYISALSAEHIVKTWEPKKLKPGMLLGLGLGGSFAFIGAIMGVLLKGGGVEVVPFFTAGRFWWELLLSLATGFWETLFFFSWIGNEIYERFEWPLIWKIIGIATVFLAFHIPNTVMQFPDSAVLPALLLVGLFAVGQSLIFYRWRNLYLLTLTHALWGMTLLFHL